MPKHIVCGIDPGLSGGYTIIDGDGRIVVIDDIPTLEVGKRKLVDAVRLADVLIANDVNWIGIEDVHAMPGQGVVSTGNFMKAVGTVYGVAGALGTTVSWASPVAWKKHFGLIGKDKDASRVKAIELFPAVADQLRRKRDINRAESLLIAAYTCMADVAKIEQIAASVGATASAAKAKRRVDDKVG